MVYEHSPTVSILHTTFGDTTLINNNTSGLKLGKYPVVAFIPASDVRVGVARHDKVFFPRQARGQLRSRDVACKFLLTAIPHVTMCLQHVRMYECRLSI